MTDQKSGTRSSVGLLDIATHVPGLLLDAPTIVRGVITEGGVARAVDTSEISTSSTSAAPFASDHRGCVYGKALGHR